MKKIQISLGEAGQRLNEATGYSNIETQKRRIEEQESIVLSALDSVNRAKLEYDTSIKLRSSSQREVNELLQRKSNWDQSDLERFTTLFRSDHTNSLKEDQCKLNVEQAEGRLEEARNRLSSMILSRYHEEQIWSDKIRRVSTWGTWALMGVNIILFVFVQLALEPWKRQRLVARFEDRLRQVVQEERIQAQLTSNTEVKGPKIQTNQEESFFTDADLQGQQFNHTIHQVDAHDDSFLTDADYSATNFEHLNMADGVKDDQDIVGHNAIQSLLWHETISMHAKSWAEHLWQKGRGFLAWAFSPRPSNVPMEDITCACIASSLLGIAIGLFAVRR